MFNPEDHHTMERMLGCPCPEKLEKAYMALLRMTHRGGGGGPLGTNMCALFLHINGLLPPDAAILEAEQQKKTVNWKRVPIGARVITNRQGKRKQGGVFCGMVQHGTLAVKLDHNAMVTEIYPHEVRLPIPNMAPDIKQHTMEVQETEDKVGKAYLEQAEERLAQDDVADANADDELEREEAEAAEMEDENDYSQEDNMAKFLRDLGEGGDEPPRDPRPEDGDAPSEEAEEEDGEVEAAAGANYAARASAKFTLGEEIQYEGPGDTLISAKFERDGAFDDEIIVTVGGKKAVIQRLSVLTPEEVDA